MPQISHNPDGDPCRNCGLPAYRHRKPRIYAHHPPLGDPCLQCGNAADVHTSPKELAARKAYRNRPEVQRRRDRYFLTHDRTKQERYLVGIDGEGVTLPDGRHIYTYLAAMSEHGKLVSEAFNPTGLTHEECRDMLLRIPRPAINFGFMFSYDVTKIIESMSLVDRYTLLRPDTRRATKCVCDFVYRPPLEVCPNCDTTIGGHSFIQKLRHKGHGYDFFNGALSVCGQWAPETSSWKKIVKVWDVFRFFGTAFVEAVRDWQIHTPNQVPYEECYCGWSGPVCKDCPSCGSDKDKKWWTPELKSVSEMKAKRGSLIDESDDDVKNYCRRECYLLALMMRKVINSHLEAGLKLTQFNGAGSTAGVMANKFGVKRYKGPDLRTIPRMGKSGKGGDHLYRAVLSAFFGGRFEHNVIGLVRKPIFSRDIASAYPYAMTFHPCLACGVWRHIKGPGTLQAVERARLAVVRFRVREEPSAAKREQIAWMPLPYRDKKGSISFPTGCHGWAWKPEILSALAGWGDQVDISEAWTYETECGHAPFGFLPSLYRERVRWGKEGPGKCLKLGINALYGRTAQNKGKNPPYQSWVWAGNTTSVCRAMQLDAIQRASDPWNLFSIATDGLCTTEELDLEEPRDTGTDDLKKPLGVWEQKEVPSGVFFIKPGMYYAIDTKLDDVRARGVGRREVYEDRKRIEDGFLDWDRKDFDRYHVSLFSSRFYGAKHSIMARSRCMKCNVSWPGHITLGCPRCRRLGDDLHVQELKAKRGKGIYGTWDQRETKIAFDPFPKREAVFGGDRDHGRMRIRDMGGRKSVPYDRAKLSDEAMQTRESQEFAESQYDFVGSFG